MQADRNGHQWSREDVKTLRPLVNGGMALVDIAKALQRTTLGVRSKAMLVGLKLSSGGVWLGTSGGLAEGRRPLAWLSDPGTIGDFLLLNAE